MCVTVCVSVCTRLRRWLDGDERSEGLCGCDVDCTPINVSSPFSHSCLFDPPRKHTEEGVTNEESEYILQGVKNPNPKRDMFSYITCGK